MSCLSSGCNTPDPRVYLVSQSSIVDSTVAPAHPISQRKDEVLNNKETSHWLYSKTLIAKPNIVKCPSAKKKKKANLLCIVRIPRLIVSGIR